MAAETTFDIDGVNYTVDRREPEWELTLRRSLVPVRHEVDLDLLAHEEDGLLPCRISTTADSVTLHLTPEPGLIDWSAVLNRPRADVLRALINVADCARLVDRGYAVVLHPANLVLDRNLRPRLLYRGLAGVMPPQAMGADQVLRQYQALAIAAFSSRTSYDELVTGALVLRRASAFDRRVLDCGSVAELRDYLIERYDEVTARDDATLVRVTRRSYRVFRHATIWLAVIAVVAVAATVRTTFVAQPFQERLLTADMHYVKLDHDGVIETLSSVPVDRLPATQRYELAISYLRSANLSEDQKAAVQNTLSITGDEAVLTYWVQIGRGQLEEALDNAKGLNDTDLILYAITLLQEQVGADPSLSGTDREARLKELQGQYDEYWEVRNAAVEDGSTDAATEGTAEAAGTASEG